MTPSLTPSLVWRQHCLLEPPTTTYSPLENQFTQLGSQPRLRSFPIYQIGTLKYIRLEGKFFVFEKVESVVVAFKTYLKEHSITLCQLIEIKTNAVVHGLYLQRLIFLILQHHSNKMLCIYHHIKAFITHTVIFSLSKIFYSVILTDFVCLHISKSLKFSTIIHKYLFP